MNSIIKFFQKMRIDISSDEIRILKYSLMKGNRNFYALYLEFRKGALHSFYRHISILGPHH